MNANQIKSLAYALALLALGQPRLGAQTLTVLHTFTNGADGSIPYSGLVQSGNRLYGTASSFNPSGTNNGTVFGVNTDGTGFTTLHNFTALDPVAYTNSDGMHPYAALVVSGDTLYGVAHAGGPGAAGTVFKVSTNGLDFATVYGFTAVSGVGGPYGTNADGAFPQAGLAVAGNTLYGTTYYGGSATNGTVFRVNTDGTCFTNLHNFQGINDGANPGTALVVSGDTLYGSAQNGGSDNYGTVFRLNTDGTCFTNLHSFAAGLDGATPVGSLVLSSNTLFGLTYLGPGVGTLFALNTDGTGFSTLHTFTNQADGWGPQSGLTLSGHTLFGGTQFYGSGFWGTVFKVNLDGSDFRVLYSFTNGVDGASPMGAIALSGDTLYGTTSSGGSAGFGTAYALNLSIPLDFQRLDNGVVLSWSDPSFLLQAAPAPSGVFTNVPGATSPYTNSFTDAQMFFRLHGQ